MTVAEQLAFQNGFFTGYFWATGIFPVVQEPLVYTLRLTFNITDTTSFTPFSTITTSSVVIDWGDGNSDSLMAHSYAETGLYVINITFTGLTEISFMGITNLIKVQGRFNGCSGVTSLASCFKDYTALVSISYQTFISCVNVTTFAFCFSGCSALLSVPEGLFNSILLIFR